jgi:hypothetical protein
MYLTPRPTSQLVLAYRAEKKWPTMDSPNETPAAKFFENAVTLSRLTCTPNTLFEDYIEVLIASAKESQEQGKDCKHARHYRREGTFGYRRPYLRHGRRDRPVD